jgi:hypothetical protein
MLSKAKIQATKVRDKMNKTDNDAEGQGEQEAHDYV